jgi:hypothetical protein
MGSSGRILLVVAATVFGVAFFWVHGSIGSITGFSLQNAREQNVPIFEPDNEEPTANLKADVPEPILIPVSTQTPPLEPAEIAADPQTSEAGEIALREPPAEGAKKPDEANDKDVPLRGAFGSPAGLPAEPSLPQPKSSLSDSTSFGSPPSENTPALSQDPAQLMADPYTDDTLLPAAPQPVSPDTPTSTEETSTEETSPQPPPVTDTGTATLPPEPSGETTTSSSDLPADSSLFAEDTADLE